MRLTIGKKITGTTIVLILAMVGIASWSSLKMSHVSDEMESIADLFIPITQAVSTVEVQILNQEIILGTIEYYSETNTSKKKINNEINEFNKISEEIDEKIQQEILLIDTFKLKAKNNTDLEELTILEENLKTILQKHIQFHDEAIVMIKQLQKGDNRLLNKVLLLQNELNQELEETYIEIAGFTQDAANLAEAHELQAVKTNTIATVAITILGLILAIVITRGIVIPLVTLLKTTQHLTEGNLDSKVEIKSNDEVGDLGTAFNEMASGLKKSKADLNTFGQFIDPTDITADDKTIVSGKKQHVTIFYSTLNGFKEVMGNLDPEKSLNVINQFFSNITSPIQKNQGIIDKYEENSMVAFWTPPFTPQDSQHAMACKSALEIPAAFDNFKKEIIANSENKDQIKLLSCNIGVVTQEVIVGAVGGNSKRLTLVNNDTNTGELLKEATKLYGTFILVDQPTKEQSEDTLVFRKIDKIRSNKTEPVIVYEPITTTENVSQNKQKEIETFNKAIQAYEKKDFKAAKKHFETCLKANKNDKTVQVYIKRLDQLILNPPVASWDGVWVI